MEKVKPMQAAKANVARICSGTLSGKNSSSVSRATAALEKATMTDTRFVCSQAESSTLNLNHKIGMSMGVRRFKLAPWVSICVKNQ